MNLMTLLQAQAQIRPRAAAIIAPDGAPTFLELDRAAAQTAALLQAAGLRTGDPVLVLQPMSAALYVSLLAIFRLGLVATFLDPSAGRAHIERCCALYPPQGFIGLGRAHLLRLLAPALRRIPHKFSTGVGLPGTVSLRAAARMSPHESIATVTAETPALVTFTSGSTGEPKAAVRTHGFLLTQHAVLAHHLELVPGEVDICTLPIFALANLASGVTSVIPDAELRRPGAIDPAPVWAQCGARGASRSAASPAFFECLIEHGERNGLQLRNMSKLYTGGAPVFPTLLERLQKIAPLAQVVAVYGSTEAEPIAHIKWKDIHGRDFEAMRAGKGLLAGVPVKDIELGILRDQWGTPVAPCTRAQFAQECMPAGEAGEIVVSGAHVLRGYLGRRGDAETKFEVDGVRWHRTGDAGYLDAYGRLWLLGRASARVSDARGVLFPFSVECAATTVPGVRRSALVSHRGRRLLVVEASRTLDLDGLRSRLAWAQLDAVHQVERIPVDKRHNAKVDYPALTKRIERMIANKRSS